MNPKIFLTGNNFKTPNYSNYTKIICVGMCRQYERVCMCVCVILPVDPISALALIQAGHAGTFINVDLAVLALEAGHTLTRVGGDVVSAGGAVLAGMNLALIDLHLAVNPCRGQRQAWQRAKAQDWQHI